MFPAGPGAAREIDRATTHLDRLQTLDAFFKLALLKAFAPGPAYFLSFIHAEWMTGLSPKLEKIEKQPHYWRNITRISAHMHSFLLLLDDILDDAILDHKAKLSVSLKLESGNTNTNNQPIDIPEEFAKLTALIDLIKWRYKSAAIEPDILSELSDEKLFEFLKLKDLIDRSGQIMVNLDDLIWSIKKVFPDVSSSENDVPLVDILDDAYIDAAKHAKNYSVNATRIFKLLSQSITCDLEHVGIIHLSGFGQKEPEIDILLSPCSRQLPHGFCNAEVKPQSFDSFDSLLPNQQASLNICTQLENSLPYQDPMKIVYKGWSIWEGRTRHSRKKPDLEEPHVSLRDLFQSGDANQLGERDRFRLEYLLAQSLPYLFQSPWLPKLLDLHVITLIREQSNRNPAKPYAKPYVYSTLTRLNPEDLEIKAESYNDDEIYEFMLTFGFLLLQIELGRELDLNEEERSDEKHSVEIAFSRHIEEQEGNIKDPLKQIFNACLDFSAYIDKIDYRIKDPSIKSYIVIIKHILSPLKELLEVNYPSVAKDLANLIQLVSTKQVATQQDYPTCQSNKDLERESFPTALTHSAEPRISQFQASAEMQADHNASRNYVGGREMSMLNVHQHPQAPHQNSTQSSTHSEKDSAHRADEFFCLYDVFYERYMRPKRLRARIKIAVLDTGIDITHPTIAGHLERIKSERFMASGGKIDNIIKATRSFVEGEPVDQCGHGTRVVELLLRVAPHADLYLGKISNSINDNDMSSASNITNALNWAVEQNVDIINMSFVLHEWDIKIHDAIHEAAKTTCLFAAASNTGGNGTRAFPATHPDVFGIHALDGRGEDVGGINPPPGKHNGRWGTLGLNIPFLIKKETSYEKGTSYETSYKKGTSYATSIVAGTVANVFDHLNFLREIDKLSEDRYIQLRTWNGVNNILWLMSTPCSYGPLRYVAPWHLWNCHSEGSETKIRESEDQVLSFLLNELCR